MLLIVGYDRGVIERYRASFRKYGYPTFGSTLRGLGGFSHAGCVTAVLFPTPVSRERTEYALSVITKKFPSALLAVCLNEEYTMEDAAQNTAVSLTIPPRARFPRLLGLLREGEYLYPIEAFRMGVFRDRYSDAPLFYARPFPIPLTPTEYTLISLALLLPAGVSWELIRDTCFSLLANPSPNTVSAMISRLNKRMRFVMQHKFIAFDRECGYYIF